MLFEASDPEARANCLNMMRGIAEQYSDDIISKEDTKPMKTAMPHMKKKTAKPQKPRPMSGSKLSW